MRPSKPFVELELRPVEAPSCASEGARVFMLLPTVDELLGVTAFGSPRPINLPEDSRLRGGWSIIGRMVRHPDWTVH
ncbi:MAG: hypothetical protein AB7O60_17515 [Variibacter sp.]